MNLKYGTKKVPFLKGGPIPRLHQPLLLATGITWETLESQETFPIFFPQAHINYDNKPKPSCRGLRYSPVEGFWNGKCDGNPHQQDEGKKGEFAMRGVHQEK